MVNDRTNFGPSQRYFLVDLLRGMAVFLMIIFHGAYDLTLFKYLSIDFQEDTFWFSLPRLIVLLFFTCVGIGLCLVHLKKIRWNKVFKRTLQLGICSLVISLFTYNVFRDRWIYFGTLHSITAGSLLGLLFLKYPKTSFGLIIAIWSFYFSVWMKWNFLVFEYILSPIGLSLPSHSMDYIPLFPWFSHILLGIVLYHLKVHTWSVPIWIQKYSTFLLFFGRHALIIYLLHQPLLFSLTWCLSKLFPAF